MTLPCQKWLYPSGPSCGKRMNREGEVAVHRALMLLLGLQTRAWLRHAIRGLAKPKGAAFAFFGLLIFVPWLVSVFVSSRGHGLEPEQTRLFGPLALAGYC